ncbi:MAG: hypothetical protein KatS3mg077_3358 [Candidatus Binatia bacterium]|nr:MAG: hypothetical protein KatS3mg077_3358 [Candidatus Binatia bacterium]
MRKPASVGDFHSELNAVLPLRLRPSQRKFPPKDFQPGLRGQLPKNSPKLLPAPQHRSGAPFPFSHRTAQRTPSTAAHKKYASGLDSAPPPRSYPAPKTPPPKGSLRSLTQHATDPLCAQPLGKPHQQPAEAHYSETLRWPLSSQSTEHTVYYLLSRRSKLRCSNNRFSFGRNAPLKERASLVVAAQICPGTAARHLPQPRPYPSSVLFLHQLLYIGRVQPPKPDFSTA